MSGHNYPKMLPEPLQVYAMDGPYPDVLRVSFSDGSTQIYDLRKKVTEPELRERLERFSRACGKTIQKGSVKK